MRGSGAPWSRPALVGSLYFALGVAGFVWSAVRGHPVVWRVAGRAQPQVLAGIGAGLLMGLGLVFAWQLAAYRFDWVRALHRDFRARLGPLSGADCVVFAGASALGEEI